MMNIKYLKNPKTREKFYPITKSDCIIDAFSINDLEIDKLFEDSLSVSKHQNGMSYLNLQGLIHYHSKIKDYFNSAPDVQIYTAGENIDITNNVISSRIPTSVENQINTIQNQQNNNIQRLDEIEGIANEANERSKVNTSRLDDVGGKALAAYEQIGRIDDIQGDVNTAKESIKTLQYKIGEININTGNIETLIDRMDTAEGTANGADKRSLLNSGHIETIYSLVYENKDTLSEIELTTSAALNDLNNRLLDTISDETIDALFL